MERTNKIYVIGTLTQVKDIRTGEKANEKGQNVAWIAGTALVESGNSEIEFKFYSSAQTKAGKENKKYANYETLQNRVGERVKVNGEIQGRLWYNEGQGQMINFNELNPGFFNTAKPTEEDVATFEYTGFVTKELHERFNKDEELIAYEIEIAQANYNQDNMQIVKFTVNTDQVNIISAVQDSYLKNSTVSINGEIHYEVIEETQTEEVAFGEPIVKTFRNLRKTFVVTGGKQPIVDEALAYSQTDIEKLQSAYTTFMADVEKQAKEKNAQGNSSPTNKPAQNSNQNRLL